MSPTVLKEAALVSIRVTDMFGVILDKTSMQKKVERSSDSRKVSSIG